jgi:transcription elongation factor GreA
MPEIHYLPAEGQKRLQKELEELIGPRRRELSARLRSAIQQGDLSENADYIQAKEDQGFLEGRIQELEMTLRNVVIIDENKQHRDHVDVGAHITVQEDDSLPETYYLVGPKEANPVQNRISHESPIGKALMGHRVDEEVIVETPAGNLRLKILKIE